MTDAREPYGLSARESAARWRFGDVVLDEGTLELTVRGARVDLARKPLELLMFLVRNRDKVVTKEELFRVVWPGRIVSETSLTNAIGRLRSAIGDDRQEVIKAVYGYGYRFDGAVAREGHGQDPATASEPARKGTIDAPAPARPASAPAKPRWGSLWAPLAALAGCAVAAAILLWSQPRGEPPAVPQRSIAVLPFANLSDAPQNAYFVDGLQDQILTSLAQIHALKVISRSSVEHYRGRVDDVAAIGTSLGVGALLEGSVQRDAARARINLQLIDAASGAQLWARSYDRTLDDLFGVESEVSRDVAQALEVALSPEESSGLSTAPTRDVAAYDLYLQALEHYRRGRDPVGRMPVEMPQAIALLEEALRRDARFGLAAALLSDANMLMFHFAPDHSPARLAAARAAADQALAADPSLGRAHDALGMYYYLGFRDYAAALSEFRVAQRLLPNDADVAGHLAAVARRQGRWEQALEGFRRAAELDPYFYQWRDELGLTARQMRRYPESDEADTRALALSLSPADIALDRARNAVAWKGNLEMLRTALEGLGPRDPETLAGSAAAFYWQAWLSRDYRAAAAAAAAAASAGRGWIEPEDARNIGLPASLMVARALKRAGKQAETRAAFDVALKQLRARVAEQPGDPDAHCGLGLAYAGLGRADDAVREAERAVALRPISQDAHSGPSFVRYLALVYLETGQERRALGLLAQLMSIPAGDIVSPALLSLDPDYDALRRDPDFQALIGKATLAAR